MKKPLIAIISICICGILIAEKNTLINRELVEYDEYNIPIHLYKIDSELAKLKATIYSRKKSAKLFGFGGICFSVIGGLLWLAAPDVKWAPYEMETSIPFGAILTIFGGGMTSYSIIGILPSINKSESNLVEYFNINY